LIREHRAVPGFMSFALALAVMGWAALRLQRSEATLTLALCLSLGLFFLFGRQAFCNYYFLIQGLWIMGLGWLAKSARVDARPLRC
jgi:hypothetical protein